MRRAPPIALLFLFVSLAASQTPPPPQTARQALIEMFFGTTPNHLEKHLPDVTRNSLKKLASANGMNTLDEFSMLASQLKSGGGKFETFETGPTLLSTEDAEGAEKFELTVERDDLAGDEDQIELALHMTKNFKEEAMPFIPRFIFIMVQQADVWRLNEIDVTVKVPLSDPTFLKSIEDRQHNQSEMMTIFAMQSIVGAEKSYSTAQGAFACSLSALGTPVAGTNRRAYLFDRQLMTGKKNGYIFVISNCDAAHYKVVAEPEVSNSGQRAFCSDEGGEVRASADGKASTCLSSGEPVEAGPRAKGVLVAAPAVANAANAPSTAKPVSPNGSTAPSTPRVRVSAGVAQGLLVSRVSPTYPADAKKAKAQGTVVIHAIIGRDGSVQSENVVSSPSPLLNQAALDAVKQWKYTPYLLNGAAVEVDTQININFSLSQ